MIKPSLILYISTRGMVTVRPDDFEVKAPSAFIETVSGADT